MAQNDKDMTTPPESAVEPPDAQRDDDLSGDTHATAGEPAEVIVDEAAGPDPEPEGPPLPETAETAAEPAPFLPRAEPDLPKPDMTEPEPARPGVMRVVPLVIGGLLAGGIGFAIATWLIPAGTDDAVLARLTAQQQQVAALTERLDALPPPPDIDPLRNEIAAIRADLVAQTDGLRPALTALVGRLDQLERAPSGDGTLSETAFAAWQGELDTLRADLAAQGDRVDTLAAEAAARIDATAQDIAQIEAQATAATVLIARRAALSRVLAALDSGAPFDTALTEALGDQPPPATLAATAAAGVPTLAALRDSFPEAARASLAVARDEGLAGEPGGVWGFLREQFDVRSTTPRDGDTPDAILSRAEAALADHRLDDALAEIAALPEVARGAMGDWLTRAEIRRTALQEAESLSATLAAVPDEN